jgi:Haem-degrading
MRRILLTTLCGLALTSSVMWADNDGVNVNQACRSLPSYAALRAALIQGGLALYNNKHQLIGALGVSGDSSCADHNIAWRTRHTLNLDFVPSGVSGDSARPDNIVFDITPQAGQIEGVSGGGWGHPLCSAAATTISKTLPVKQ